MKPTELQNPKYFFWIATALVLGYFLLSLLPNFSLTLSNETQASTRPRVAVKNAEAAMIPSSPTAIGEVSAFARKYEECLQIFSQPSALDPAQLLKKIQTDLVLKELQLGIENFHLLDPQGLERRLHVRPEDSKNGRNRYGQGREVLVMDVDAEGLPILRSSQPATESILKNLLKDGQIQYHSRKESLSFENGFMAEVEWVNEKIHDLQIFSLSHTFSCRDLECKCD